MSEETQKAFDNAMERLEYRIPTEQRPELLGVIRAHVAAQDAEIAELKACLTVETKHLDAAIQRDDSKGAQLLAANRRIAKLEKERDALRTRIESAPKVWLFWEMTPGLEQYATRATEIEREARAWDLGQHHRIECVHAVPVEPKEGERS